MHACIRCVLAARFLGRRVSGTVGKSQRLGAKCGRSRTGDCQVRRLLSEPCAAGCKSHLERTLRPAVPTMGFLSRFISKKYATRLVQKKRDVSATPKQIRSRSRSEHSFRVISKTSPDFDHDHRHIVVLRRVPDEALHIFANCLHDFRKVGLLDSDLKVFRSRASPYFFPVFVFRFTEAVGVKHERIA